MLEFDTSSLSDDEILNKIEFINKQLAYSSTMPSARFVANQLYNYLDLLYQEQDERLQKELAKNITPGLVYDSESEFKKEEKDTNKKKSTKKVNFLAKGPKIERKYNQNHPSLKSKDEQNGEHR